MFGKRRPRRVLWHTHRRYTDDPTSLRTVVLTLHREISLEIDDTVDESEEVLTDRVTQLAEQQFGMFDE